MQFRGPASGVVFQDEGTSAGSDGREKHFCSRRSGVHRLGMGMPGRLKRSKVWTVSGGERPSGTPRSVVIAQFYEQFPSGLASSRQLMPARRCSGWSWSGTSSTGCALHPGRWWTTTPRRRGRESAREQAARRRGLGSTQSGGDGITRARRVAEARPDKGIARLPHRCAAPSRVFHSDQAMPAAIRPKVTARLATGGNLPSSRRKSETKILEPMKISTAASACFR